MPAVPSPCRGRPPSRPPIRCSRAAVDGRVEPGQDEVGSERRGRRGRDVGGPGRGGRSRPRISDLRRAVVQSSGTRSRVAANRSGTAKGHAEIDGCYIGGSIRQENDEADRRDRRLTENQTGKRRVVVVMRERGGRTLPFAVRSPGRTSVDADGSDRAAPFRHAAFQTGGSIPFSPWRRDVAGRNPCSTRKRCWGS